MTAVSPVDPRLGGSGPPMALRSSPLASRANELVAAGSSRVRLAEEPFLTQVDLRVAPEDEACPRIERALGVSLPHAPNFVGGAEELAALWLGPDEWLIVAPDGRASPVVDSLRTGLGGAFGSTVDVSANRTTLRLSGRLARDVLEKVCSLDLHPRVFGPGQCAQTLLGRTQAILWQVSAEPGYRVLVRCSFADYLADLLLDAMAEFAD